MKEICSLCGKVADGNLCIVPIHVGDKVIQGVFFCKECFPDNLELKDYRITLKEK